MRQREGEAQHGQHEWVDEPGRDKARRNRVCTNPSASRSAAAKTVSWPRSTRRIRTTSFRSASVLHILAAKNWALHSSVAPRPGYQGSRHKTKGGGCEAIEGPT